MRFFNFKLILVLLVIGFVSFKMHAQSASQSFQTICLNTWMERLNDAKDKLNYRNFGEKYCECAAQQVLDNDEAVNKAIQLCMSRTLLHHIMDSIEEDMGLAEAAADDITKYCLERWNLVYPQLSENGKRVTHAYCECAKSKLMHIIKEADSITDKQYVDQVNMVAVACS